MRHDTIRFVTANFYQLQGLRLVPLGVLVIWIGLVDQGWLAGPLKDNRVEAAAFVLTLGFMILATFHYKRRYGVVAQYSRGIRNALIGLAMLGWFVLSGMIQGRLQWPVSLSSLFLSACLFATVWVDGPIRRHYLLGAIAWLVVGFLPVFSATHHVPGLVFYVTGGLTLIVCGIGDHLLIARTLADTENHVSNPAIV